MVAPLLVELADQFNTSVGAMGLLTAAGAIPWALLAPFMGVLGDRLGRRPVVTAGLAALGATTILSALAWDYNSLFFFRVLGAVGGATTGPNFFAATADYFPRQRRGRAMGVYLAGISMATVAGVPLTALLSAYVGWRWAFAVVGTCLVMVAAVAWRIFPATGRASSPEGYISSLSRALTVRATRLLLAANILERASFTAVSTYLAAFLIQSYGLRLDEVAPALSATAAGTLLGSLFGGRLADRGKQALQFPLFQVAAAGLVLPIFLFTPGLLPTALLAAAFGLTSFPGQACLDVASQPGTLSPEERHHGFRRHDKPVGADDRGGGGWIAGGTGGLLAGEHPLLRRGPGGSGALRVGGEAVAEVSRRPSAIRHQWKIPNHQVTNNG